MRVPLSWLRDYVDIQLTPEQLAERLTLLGMEVKGIEAWGADWQNVVVGELLSVERHPRADRLSLTRVTIGDGEALEIVCGATNIAAGQRVPVALPGAVLPGDRRIERTEKMGVVSNGMLCSGDELKLTSDADGILILPPETPLGVPLGGPVRRRGARCRRQAESRRCAEPDRPCTRGVGRDRSAGPIPADRPGRDGPVHRRAPDGRGPGTGAVHPVRRPLGRRRHGQAVARPGPDAIARRRTAAGQQRRRCQQLRHVGTRQAHPHLRRDCRSRREDRRAPGPRRRAHRDARPRRCGS